MSPTILPCPFCGGIAEIDTLSTYRAISDGHMAHSVSIYCLSCDAQMMRCYADHPGEEREDVCAALTEAWNTRALEREAKAEPVAWRKRIPWGKKAHHFITSNAEIAQMWREEGFDVEPLYISPDDTRIAELEAEVDRLKTYDLQSSQCITNLNRYAVKWADEAARWREVARQCAEELTRALSINWKDAPDEAMDIHQSARCALSNYRDALTAYNAALKEENQ